MTMFHWNNENLTKWVNMYKAKIEITAEKGPQGEDLIVVALKSPNIRAPLVHRANAVPFDARLEDPRRVLGNMIRGILEAAVIKIDDPAEKELTLCRELVCHLESCYMCLVNEGYGENPYIVDLIDRTKKALGG